MNCLIEIVRILQLQFMFFKNNSLKNINFRKNEPKNF